jgi:hypothetical protein
MKDDEHISINIWDDFYDDGCVPDGEKSQTYIYVEDDGMSHDDRRNCLEIIIDYIQKNLNTDGIRIWMELYESRKSYPNLVGNPEAEKMFFDRWEIRLENITHEKVHEWLSELEDSKLTFNGKEILFYSES